MVREVEEVDERDTRVDETELDFEERVDGGRVEERDVGIVGFTDSNLVVDLLIRVEFAEERVVVVFV